MEHCINYVYDFPDVASKASVLCVGTEHVHADLMTKELVVGASWDRPVKALNGEFDVKKAGTHHRSISCPVKKAQLICSENLSRVCI